MHHEHPDHAHHLLHGPVRVVEERPMLVQVEFVGEPPARRYRLLADIRHAVHLDGDLETMPVHGGRFRKMVIEDDAHSIALYDLNGRPRASSVVPPDVHRSVWHDFPFHGLSDQVKYLHTAFQSVGQAGNVRSLNDHGCGPIVAVASVDVIRCSTSALFVLAENLGCGETTRTEAEYAANKRPSAGHKALSQNAYCKEALVEISCSG